jgi:hypothetical protein
VYTEFVLTPESDLFEGMMSVNMVVRRGRGVFGQVPVLVAIIYPVVDK